MTCTIRTYRPTDLEEIVALINAADTVDQSQEGTSIQEKQEWLTVPGLIPEENVFIAEEDDGRIVGYAQLRLVQSDAESSFRVRFQVHPIRRGRGLEERILARLYARAQERLPECTSPVIHFSTHTYGSDKERLALLEQFGMREIRRSWLMVHPSLDDIPEPRFPAGIRTRAYRVRDDDVAMHRADTEVFRDHWGHVDEPLERWLHYMSSPSVKPELSVIAEDEKGQIAGFCMVAINDDENRRLGLKRGWIDILGVRRPYRRQGLGTALLQQGIRNIRAAGLNRAVLGCDAENLTGATRVYKRMGFQVDKIQIIMRKPVTRAEVQTVQGEVWAGKSGVLNEANWIES